MYNRRMTVTKPKNMPPFWVLKVFGQSYKNYQYSEPIVRLLMEIEFKWSAVLIAFDLIIKQEGIIQKKHKDITIKARSYHPEVEQMAYLGFFLDAIYALTERISHVTKIFHQNQLRDGFNTQRKTLLEKPQIDPSLSKLMEQLTWYDLFREVRVQHSHYGTSILAFGYDKEPRTGSSQLIIEVGGGEKKKILTGSRYNFDLRKTAEIKEGLQEFIQEWSLVLLRKLDIDTTITPGESKENGAITLKNFMEGRK